MLISITLAKIIGLYCVITALAMLFHGKRFKALASEFVGSPALLNLSGILALIIGLILVVMHDVWILAWPLIITLLSWVILLKGMAMLFTPTAIIEVGKKMDTCNVFYYTSAGITLIIGVTLCYFGFAVDVVARSRFFFF
ncbi:MAG: hypothetical protein V3V61_06260 [Gammaproteobacteria bacterium]